jgi:hypothetical protein
MTNIQIKYNDREIKFVENKTNFVNIKSNFHHSIYKKLGLHYDQYELIHNNVMITDETIINMIYLNIDILCLDIKINSELECMSFILKSNDGCLMNNCYLCGIPIKNCDICSFCNTCR